MSGRQLLVSAGVASMLAGTGLAIAADAGSAAPCPRSASLRLVDGDPVRIAGAGFCAGERVRVRARAGGVKRVRRLRADDRGEFRVRFGALDHDPCSTPVFASAWSGGELRASLKHAQKLCPPE
jgi:hypothetical protein